MVIGVDTQHAAKRLLTRLLQKQGPKPRRMITDKLGSCGAAKKQVMPGVEHRSHKGLNNRAENSHVPFRKRERIVQHSRSAGALQRFVSVFPAVRNLFVPPRASRSAPGIHLHRLMPSLSGILSPSLLDRRNKPY
jgi:putative transposase